MRKIPAVEAQTPDTEKVLLVCANLVGLERNSFGKNRLPSQPTNGIALKTLAASPALESVRERTVPPRQEAVPV